MTKCAGITSLSVDEAKAKIRAGESRSDFAALDKSTDADIRAQAAVDSEERDWDLRARLFAVAGAEGRLQVQR